MQEDAEVQHVRRPRRSREVANDSTGEDEGTRSSCSLSTFLSQQLFAGGEGFPLDHSNESPSPGDDEATGLEVFHRRSVLHSLWTVLAGTDNLVNSALLDQFLPVSIRLPPTAAAATSTTIEDRPRKPYCPPFEDALKATFNEKERFEEGGNLAS